MSTDLVVRPKSIQETWVVSELLWKGIGKAKYDCPEKVFAVVLCGLEIGLAPTQSLASIALWPNGTMSIYGDAALALVYASGLLETFEETWSGEGENRKATCKAKRKGGTHRSQDYSLVDANRAGLIERGKEKDTKNTRPWVANPDRQLMFRARGFLLRDLFPDVLRGLITYEEASDSSDIQNAEVKVTSVASSATTATEQPATSTKLPTSTPPLALDGPVTQEQLVELGKLRELHMNAKQIREPLAIKSEWEQILAPFGTTTAKSLTAGMAAKLIAELGEKNDPFSHPTTQPSSA